MPDSTVLGYAAKAAGQPLEPFSYAPPKLGEHDVRVSVTHCGVCYSDIQAIEDYYGVIHFPLVPGHEIVGRVSEVSRDASGLRVGDRVGIGWQGRSCGKCEWCACGEEQLCVDVVGNGTWVPYGGFASSVAVDSRFAYPLPEAMPAETAAVLLCGGISVYSPLRKYAAAGRQRIGIIGVGGLGHLAIQFAHALGHDVTVISTSAAKQAQALAFGADQFILASDRDRLREEAFGFALLLCTAHGKVKWEPLLETLKRRGTLVLVGFPDVAFNSTDVVAHELTIAGSFLGNRATMKEMLGFAQAHRITPRTELMPMSRVNEAIQRVRDNKARYRVVLANDAPAA
jgi:uncharacterized zinc-type alcohol dehydrogenase-like protein